MVQVPIQYQSSRISKQVHLESQLGTQIRTIGRTSFLASNYLYVGFHQSKTQEVQAAIFSTARHSFVATHRHNRRTKAHTMGTKGPAVFPLCRTKQAPPTQTRLCFIYKSRHLIGRDALTHATSSLTTRRLKNVLKSLDAIFIRVLSSTYDFIASSIVSKSIFV